MGHGIFITCDGCDFLEFGASGPMMSGIALTACVCAPCAQVVTIEHGWDDEPELICPECSAAVIPIPIAEPQVHDAEVERSTSAPCPTCGGALHAEFDGRLLD